MANWYGTARSNYFTVKDKKAFSLWLEKFPDLEVRSKQQRDEPEYFMIFSTCPDTGGWPSWMWADDENVEDEYVNLVDEISPHLNHGQICVLMEAGAEKLRYISGNAVAFNSLGEYTEIVLSDIYDKAYDVFKIRPTEASY